MVLWALGFDMICGRVTSRASSIGCCIHTAVGRNSWQPELRAADDSRAPVCGPDSSVAQLATLVLEPLRQGHGIAELGRDLAVVVL